MIYQDLAPAQIDRALFAEFHRRQVVTKCRRKIDGVFQIVDDPFIDEWTEAEYDELVQCLKNTASSGGLVLGAFDGGKLRGFVSVEAAPLGSSGQYLDLSSLHVSAELRGQGTGRALFLAAARWAGEHGAEKLYISAHSAIESQRFYLAMGCTEAAEYNAAHAAAEPCDCQMEYAILREAP